MTVTAASLDALIEAELSALTDERVVHHVRSLLVAPQPQSRQWDYGAPDAAFPCWVVLVHKASDTGIAYSEFGFGPRLPWGLLSLGVGHLSMGMDSSWFRCFLDAYFDSFASTELPIWRVFERSSEAYPGNPITVESDWDTTWREVERLRGAFPGRRFACSQSIYQRRF
jgi:hypothetical protein